MRFPIPLSHARSISTSARTPAKRPALAPDDRGDETSSHPASPGTPSWWWAAPILAASALVAPGCNTKPATGTMMQVDAFRIDDKKREAMERYDRKRRETSLALHRRQSGAGQHGRRVTTSISRNDGPPARRPSDSTASRAHHAQTSPGGQGPRGATSTTSPSHQGPLRAGSKASASARENPSRSSLPR